MNPFKISIARHFLLVLFSCFYYNLVAFQNSDIILSEINMMRTNPTGYFQKNKQEIQSKYPEYNEFLHYVKPQIKLTYSSLFSKYAQDLFDGKQIPMHIEGKGQISYCGISNLTENATLLEFLELLLPIIHSPQTYELGYYFDEKSKSVFFVYNYGTSTIDSFPAIEIDTFSYVIEEEIEKYEQYDFLDYEERKGIFLFNLLREHPENFAHTLLKESKGLGCNEEVYIYEILKLKHQQSLPPVVPKETIQNVAKYNASLMLKDGRGGHNAGGTTMRERSNKFHCYEYPQAENIASMFNTENLKHAIVLFLKSPEHNRNMTHENNLYIGFAIARDDENAFVSMNFIQKKKEFNLFKK